MPTPLEAQLEAIVRAAVEKAVADTTERLTAEFDQQTRGLKNNRDTILREKRELESKRTHDRNGVPFDSGYTQEDEDRQLAWEAEREREKAAQNKAGPAAQPDIRHGQQDVFISRTAARDAIKYREARQAAEARGVELRVVDDSETGGVDRATGLDLRAERPQRIRVSSLRQFDDPVQRVRYLRKDQVGQSPVRHRMAAEKDGLKLMIFSSLDDLPENALAAYSEAGGE